jgi:stalled ribosome rescue protein Dom34
MNKIGIWMDHYIAHCIIAEKGIVATIKNQHESHPRYEGEGSNETQVARLRFGNNEYQTNQIERNDLKSYFESVADFVKDYQHILVFGPTTAKKEFFNVVMDDSRFDGKTLHLENSDKLTDNQMVAFVREFYSKVK